ncbi:hypothetical protein B23_0636 [Geobacillus thermoleovorans B23]|nr:hypothetical protein B23_0636 [Geobacillus thermoleovorans B23]
MFFTKSSKIFLIETWIGWVIKSVGIYSFIR